MQRLETTINQLVESLESQREPATRIQYGALLQACGDARAYTQGKRVHEHIERNHCLHGSIFLGNHLIQMYGKCGSLREAEMMFERMSRRNVVSWNSIIAANALNGDHSAAMKHFRFMLQEGEDLDSVLLITVLGSCKDAQSLANGRVINACAVESGFSCQTVVATAVLSMYTRCQSLQDVQATFYRLERKDMVAWNAMITANVELGESSRGVCLFRQMMQEGLKPSRVSFMGVLGALAKDESSSASGVEEVHASVVEAGLETDEFVGNALITACGRIGNAQAARSVFNKMVMNSTATTGTWNALIAAYTQSGQPQSAFESYEEMVEKGVKPDQITFVSVLDTIQGPEDRVDGDTLSRHAAEHGFGEDVTVSSAMLSMYCRCGSLENAEMVFSRLGARRNVISWNSMMSAYTDFGECKRAVRVFQYMQNEGMGATEATFIILLTACANSASLAQGRQVHEFISESWWLKQDVLLQNGIINMYGKSGRLELAREVFERMNRARRLNLTSWNTIMGAYARHGDGKQALTMLSRMHQEGVKPSGITYTAVLTACSHAGLFKSGRKCYEFMVKVHGLRPTLVHYGCMVDLLGRGGWLEEAEKLIRSMPMPADSSVWTALLGACKMHGDVERGKLAADKLLELDPLDSSTYVALYNL